MNTRMNTQNTSIFIAVALLMTVGVMYAEAAPHQDYFFDDDNETMFDDWFSDQGDTGLTSCDTYNTVFSANCGSRESQPNTSNIAGVGAAFSGDEGSPDEEATDEVEGTVAVEMLDQRCVDHDGAVDFEYNNVDGYELTLDSNVYEVADLAGEYINFHTFADLPDGSYILSVFNSGQQDTESFTVSCDEDDPITGSLTGSCTATPSEPEIDELVTWKVTADGGDDSYSYDWNGDVSGNTDTIKNSYGSTGEKEGYVTITSGTDFHSVRCAVDVQGGGANVTGEVQGTRTIEEF